MYSANPILFVLCQQSLLAVIITWKLNAAEEGYFHRLQMERDDIVKNKQMIRENIKQEYKDAEQRQLFDLFV